MNISLTRDKHRVTFDRKIVTGTGIVLGIKVKCRNPPDMSAIATGRRQDVNLMHGVLGHPSEQTVRATAALLGVTLTGSFVKCESCAIAKTRQKNVPKGHNTVRADKKGKRLFLDISSIQTISYGGSKFWLLIMDDHTDKTWSYFLKSKDQLSSKLIGLIKNLKATHGVKVQTLRCDNAGENKKA